MESEARYQGLHEALAMTLIEIWKLVLPVSAGIFVLCCAIAFLVDFVIWLWRQLTASEWFEMFGEKL